MLNCSFLGFYQVDCSGDQSTEFIHFDENVESAVDEVHSSSESSSDTSEDTSHDQEGLYQQLIEIEAKQKGQDEEHKGLDEEQKGLDEEQKGQDEEQKGLDEEQKGQDEEQKGLDEEQKGLDEEQKGQDIEQKGLDEERRRQDEKLKEQEEKLKEQEKKQREEEEKVRKLEEEEKRKEQEEKQSNEGEKQRELEQKEKQREQDQQQESEKRRLTCSEYLKSRSAVTNEKTPIVAQTAKAGEDLNIKAEMKPETEVIKEEKRPKDLLRSDSSEINCIGISVGEKEVVDEELQFKETVKDAVNDVLVRYFEKNLMKNKTDNQDLLNDMNRPLIKTEKDFITLCSQLSRKLREEIRESWREAMGAGVYKVNQHPPPSQVGSLPRL